MRTLPAPGASCKKDGSFGASVWLDAYDADGNLLAGHWDVNMNLINTGDDNQIPAPATLLLMGLGLVSVYASRRKAAWRRTGPTGRRCGPRQ